MWGSLLEASNFTKSPYILSNDCSRRSSADLLEGFVRVAGEVSLSGVPVELAAADVGLGRVGDGSVDGFSSTIDGASGGESSTMFCPFPTPDVPYTSVTASWFPSGWAENPPSRKKRRRTLRMATLRRWLAVPHLRLLQMPTSCTQQQDDPWFCT